MGTFIGQKQMQQQIGAVFFVLSSASGVCRVIDDLASCGL